MNPFTGPMQCCSTDRGSHRRLIFLLEPLLLLSVLCDFAACTVQQGAGPGSTTDPSGDIPNIDYCAPVTDELWEAEWIRLEQDMIAAINEIRQYGISCGNKGYYSQTDEVIWNGSLACAARMHVADMAEQNYFDHVSPSGENVNDRIKNTGYSAKSYGEILTAGHSSAQQAVDRWLESPDHCAVLMEPAFTEAGAGWYEAEGADYSSYQDITFGDR